MSTQPSTPDLILILDYDNIDRSAAPPKLLLAQWLDRLCRAGCLPSRRTLTLVVRAYGGWYAGFETSSARFEAAAGYAQAWPSILASNGVFCRVRFQFADRLLLPSADVGGTERPCPAITHTVARRLALPRLVFSLANCTDPDCELRRIRRWLRKKRGCTKSGCEKTYENVCAAKEQKQVDVHMATDLLLVSSTHEVAAIGVASDDTDLLPAVAASAVLLRQSTTHLCHLRTDDNTRYIDTELRELGVQLITIKQQPGNCEGS